MEPDLIGRLVKDLGISRIQLVEGNLPDLERWPEPERLDLLVGGQVATPRRSARFSRFR